MSLWWLQPGWGAATCACGVNIRRAGGDPDMGICPDCFEASRQPQELGPVWICETCPRVAETSYRDAEGRERVMCWACAAVEPPK